MKRQAEKAFADPGQRPARGGWRLVEVLGALLQSGPREISIVGHSAGAIYASHLMNYVHKVRGQQVPADFVFKHVVFLAPACDVRSFDALLGLRPLPWEHFRLFALKDELESGYWEVPYLYPRSLLYLVSGAFEKEPDKETGAFDLPLLGMERYYSQVEAYKEEEVRRLRQFLVAEGEHRTVWSIHAGGLGLQIDSRKHGEFFRDAHGEPAQAMKSVVHLLQHGP
jgi:hypothetical protein